MKNANKNEIIADLKYCRESLDRIINYTDKNYTSCFPNNHTVIQNDIIKLRRELNEINHKLEVW